MLLTADRGGHSDPFAVVTFAGETLEKTPVVPDTIDPLWNHSWEVSVPPAGGELQIEIFDYDEGSGDDFLGGIYSVMIGGDSADEGGQHNEALVAFGWHDLTNKKGKAVDGRVEYAFEAISQPIKDKTELSTAPVETGPISASVDILG